jgi:hypothetical protein
LKDEEDEAEMLDLELLLTKAKLDVGVVVKMLKERGQDGSLELKVPNVVIPDPKSASAERGKSVWSNRVKLLQCIADEDIVEVPNECLAVERWGSLFKWWRVVNRAFAIAGIFASLKVRRKAKGVTLRDRYEKEISGLNQKQQQKIYSYAHVCTYDHRLGRFLLEFPQFVYQLQLVSWADWFRNVDAAGGGVKKLIKCLEVGLTVDDDEGEKCAFWKQSPAN